jgi:hypothetical protein
MVYKDNQFSTNNQVFDIFQKQSNSAKTNKHPNKAKYKNFHQNCFWKLKIVKKQIQNNMILNKCKLHGGKLTIRIIN